MKPDTNTTENEWVSEGIQPAFASEGWSIHRHNKISGKSRGGLIIMGMLSEYIAKTLCNDANRGSRCFAHKVVSPKGEMFSLHLAKDFSDPKQLAEALYTRYCASVGGKAFNGDPLPEWGTFRADSAKRVQSEAWILVAIDAIALMKFESAESSKVTGAGAGDWTPPEQVKMRQFADEALLCCWQNEKQPCGEEQTKTSIMLGKLKEDLLKASGFTSHSPEMAHAH